MKVNVANLCESVSVSNSLYSRVIIKMHLGGLKVWECTNDLLEYLEKSCTQFDGLNVLDLGSGAGLLGMFALKKRASSVHFQDYVIHFLNMSGYQPIFI